MVTFFGLNLILGYLAMLVAMTYSIELFCCVVIGLCLGHFVFNTKSAVGESIDPCCASQHGPTTTMAANNLATPASPGSTNRVPLTRTPCDLEGQIDSDDDEEKVEIAKCSHACNGVSKTDDKPPSYEST